MNIADLEPEMGEDDDEGDVDVILEVASIDDGDDEVYSVGDAADDGDVDDLENGALANGGVSPASGMGMGQSTNADEEDAWCGLLCTRMGGHPLLSKR